MQVMKCMHSENVFVALLNFLCFEINNIKYKNASYIISKGSFSSQVMGPEINFLWDFLRESSCSSYSDPAVIWDYPFIPSSSIPDQRIYYWDIQYILSGLRAAVQTHVLFALLQLIWDWKTRSHQTPVRKTIQIFLLPGQWCQNRPILTTPVGVTH